MPGLLTRGFNRIDGLLPVRWRGALSRLSTRLTLAMLLMVAITALAVEFVDYRGTQFAAPLAGFGAAAGAVILAVLISRSLTRGRERAALPLAGSGFQITPRRSSRLTVKPLEAFPDD